MSKGSNGPVDLHKIASTSGMHKDLRAVARRAAALGWAGRRTGKGGITVMSPDGSVSQYLPNNNRDAGTVAKTANRAIDRWEQDREVSIIQEVTGVDMRKDVDFSDETPKCKVHDMEFVSWEGLSMHIAKDHKSDDTLDEAAEEMAEVAASLAASTSSTMDASEEIVRPWLASAHRSTKTGEVHLYESECVLEVTAGDRTFYRCALPGCTWENDEPRPVKNHYSGHVHRGEAEPVSREKKFVGREMRDRQYAPSSRLRSELAREIHAAMTSRGRRRNETPARWANALADLIMERRGEQVEEPKQDVIEVRSDADEVLDKIRDIVGMGDTEALEQALEQEKQAREEAEAKAEGYQQKWQALSELVLDD